MTKVAASRDDIDEVIDLLRTFMNQVDNRFNGVEASLENLKQDVESIINRLDSIEKDTSLNNDERAVMGMQLTRLHDWVEKAAAKIGVEFTH